MTGLDTRPVKRETRELDTMRGGRRVLVVLLEVGGKVLRIKPKGTRRWYTVTYADVYRLAIRVRAQEIKAERIERKAARKAGRL